LLKRVLEVTSVTVGIVGLALAFYWHAESVQKRAPTYYVSPERTTIVDTSVPTPSRLQILYKGRSVNQNVSGVIVYLWNDGNLPIRTEDVLEPIRVQLSPGCEILDVRILKISRAVTKLGVGEVSEKEKNSFPVTFSILEQSDGAALQVIYAGTTQANVSVGGTIVGAQEPQIIAASADRFVSRTRKDRLRSDRRAAHIGILLSVVYLAVAGGLWVVRRTPLRSRGIPTLPGQLFLVLAVLGVILVILASLLLHRTNQADSPGVPASIWTQS
jgi:hypothetical protein